MSADDYPEIDPAAWDEPGCTLGPDDQDPSGADHEPVADEIGDDETDEHGDGNRPALASGDPEPDLEPAPRGLVVQPPSIGKVPALQGPHIQAAGYRSGRARDGGRGVIYVVIHSAEGAKDELELGRFFAGSTAGSSNAGVGQDGGYASYVNYDDTAWANPPLNDNADSLEICGFAAWSRATWLAHPAMLETVAHWIAWRCQERAVPITRLTGDALRGGHGVTDHKAINDVFHASWHWDVGPGFPHDVVIKRACELAQVAASPVRPLSGLFPKAPRVKVTVEKGDTLARIGSRFRCPVAGLKQENSLERDVIRVGQELTVPDLRPTLHAKHLGELSQAYVDHGKIGHAPGLPVLAAALDAEGLLSPHDVAGAWGPNDRHAYAAWQRKLGYSGADADGVVGKTSLTKLGNRHAFKVA